jgi:hypothetical protein
MSPKLPATVTSVTQAKGGLFAVTVAYWDGTTQNYLIPPTLATAEGVTLSALVMATLADISKGYYSSPHSKHRRFLPRS